MKGESDAEIPGSEIWRLYSSRLRELPQFRELLDQLQGHRPMRLVGTPLPLAAWLVELLRRDLDRSALIVVPRESQALSWVEAGRLFAEDSSQEWSLTDFPSPSLSPFQETSTSLLVRSLEARALDRVLSARRPTVVCTPRSLFQRLPLGDDFRSIVLDLVPGNDHPVEELVQYLDAVGYRRSDLVAEVGVYAVRGGVFDLFPPGEVMPVRLDLFGDTVESIRRFDPVSQRSEGTLDRLRVRPLSLFRAGEVEAMGLASRLEEALGDDPGVEAIERIERLSRGEEFPGWQNYLPLLNETTSLHALLGSPLVVICEPETLGAEVRHHSELLAGEFAARREDKRMAVDPERVEFPASEALRVLESATLRLDDDTRGIAEVDLHSASTERLHHQLARFPREVETARARRESLLVVAPEEHHARLREWLQGDLQLRGVELAAGQLERGFRVPDLQLTLFAEEQLFVRRAPRQRAAARFGPFLSGLRDLRVGEYVVHEDHGIGRFTGIRVLQPETEASPEPLPGDSSGGAAASDVEVMEIEYSGDRSLLLPLSRIHQIQKYSGIEGAAPRLDRLGGSSWARKKSKVRSSLRKLATDLLRLYAERQLANAPAMAADSDLQAQFEAAFEYEETEDQLEASAAIKEDLQKDEPMDRLLCGDVGFGKTEVAMRAAFKVVDSGYQVAVLAPTTILADQHLETFRRRFDGFPVTVEMVSRFRSAAEVRKIRERLAKGEIDILIGTHRLLAKDIELSRLGLLVVDEEQRFGVGQKEKLKELKREVHVLAMSATPVPRTLQLSLAGVRNLSVIESPPKDRMAIETRILPYSSDLIREAIEFELERGGQIYFVYNRVEGIEEIASFLRGLVPDLRVTVGHGQMDEHELSERMHAFTRGEFDVLVATTIIESGIDIPNVNTMLVHRADRFGLAQLYQLRGRVGRSDQLAFCYLLVPGDRVLPEIARKRLQAIREFTELGAGFRVAARDLEIRGAGNLLGAEQSGHIAELGIETYLRMLEDTVRELKGEEPMEAPAASIDLPVAAAIPEQYIGDTNLRMEIYRRLAAGDEPISDVMAELRDRFGPPPESVETLVRVAELKALAETLRVQSIVSRGRDLSIRLRQDARIDVEVLIRMVSARDDLSFSPSGVLTLRGVSGSDSLAMARRTLELISPEGPPLVSDSVN